MTIKLQTIGHHFKSEPVPISGKLGRRGGGEKGVLGNIENMFGLGKMTLIMLKTVSELKKWTFVLNWKKLLIGPLY